MIYAIWKKYLECALVAILQQRIITKQSLSTEKLHTVIAQSMIWAWRKHDNDSDQRVELYSLIQRYTIVCVYVSITVVKPVKQRNMKRERKQSLD